MNSVWASMGVVLVLAVTAICLPASAPATVPNSHVVPPVAWHRAAPEPVVELNGYEAEIKVVPGSVLNPQVVPKPTTQHKVLPTQGANHEVVPQHKRKDVPKLNTNHKVALKFDKKHMVISEPEVGLKVLNKPATTKKASPEPAAKPDGIPGVMRPDSLPELRPVQVRPGSEGEGGAEPTTTTLDPLTAFCHEACRAGVGGPECNCPGHPVGRRHAPLFTP